MDLRVLALALVLSTACTQGIPEDEKVKPEDLMCHVCNGMTDAQCDDPFGKYDESGELIHHDQFQKKCNDPNVKKEDSQNNCYKTVMEEYNTYVCTCNNENFCNGASLTQASALLFALLPVVTMGLFR